MSTPWISPWGRWDQVLDPHHLGHFTDSPMGSTNLYLNAGTPTGESARQDVDAAAKAVNLKLHITPVSAWPETGPVQNKVHSETGVDLRPKYQRSSN